MADGIGVAVHVNNILEQGRALMQGPRGALLAVGLACLVLGLAVLTWLLRPRCCCRRRRRDSEDVTPPRAKGSVDEELQLDNVTYKSWARGSLYDTNLSGEGDGISRTSHRDSTYSSMSDGTDTSSILSYASGVLPNGDADDQSRSRSSSNGVAQPQPLSGPPCVVLLLQYLGNGQEGASSATGRLAVSVLEARSLPSRDYGSSPSPALQLTVAPCRRLAFRWPALLRRRQARPPQLQHLQRPVHQLRTRAVRHCRQPRYNEDFTVEARRADIKDWVLRVAVTDDCKLRGPTELCAGEVRLRQVLSASPGEPLEVVVPVAPRPEERAVMLFGLSFLPTAQRLNVSIIKATRLRLDHVTSSLAHFRPYVRVTLVHVGSGRRVDSARTEPQESSANPEFCETLSLKLAPSQLGTLSLVVALCHKLPDGGRGRDRVVGAVAIGSRVSSDRGREHWRAIEQRPRRVVSIWHTLT